VRGATSNGRPYRDSYAVVGAKPPFSAAGGRNWSEMTSDRDGRLVAAGVVLCRYENQARPRFRRTLQGCLAKGLQNADDGCIGCADAKPNGRDHGDAENKKHEERIHGQPPLGQCKVRCHCCFRIPQLFPTSAG
jgi:hypothetical protein